MGVPSMPSLGGAAGGGDKPVAFQVAGSSSPLGGALADAAGDAASAAGNVALAAVPGGGMLGGLLSGALGKREFAVLDLHQPPLDGTTAAPGAKFSEITFQFNPKDLTVAKGAQWNRNAQPTAATSAAPQFTGSSPTTMNVEAFFDASNDMSDSVVSNVEKLLRCCVPTPESLAASPPKPSPPWVKFRWGKVTGFFAVVKNVNVKYTVFTPDGLPIRAVCTVNLEEIAGHQGGQNPTSGSRAAQNLHVFVAGDTLASVAHRYYGSPNSWRAIAEANDIDDPMRLTVGATLLIPALGELAELAKAERRGHA
jgi:nucleoid-associated protein YgaU